MKKSILVIGNLNNKLKKVLDKYNVSKNQRGK